MGLVKGLKAMNQTIDRPNSSSDGPRGRWLKLNDGQSVKIKFLQELDPDSPNYNEKAGLAFIAVEHTNPADYRRKALCSIEDQGRCFGCEQHRRDPKAGWKGRCRLYCNILKRWQRRSIRCNFLSGNRAKVCYPRDYSIRRRDRKHHL